MTQLIEKRIAEYEAAHAELECLIERHQDIPAVIDGSDEIIALLRMQQLTIKERIKNLRGSARTNEDNGRVYGKCHYIT